MERFKKIVMFFGIIVLACFTNPLQSTAQVRFGIHGDENGIRHFYLGIGQHVRPWGGPGFIYRECAPPPPVVRVYRYERPREIHVYHYERPHEYRERRDAGPPYGKAHGYRRHHKHGGRW